MSGEKGLCQTRSHFPSPPGASCSPPFLPSFPKASAQRKGFSSYYAKKEEYNITGPAQPGWVPKVPDTFGKHRESNFRKGRLSRPF